MAAAGSGRDVWRENSPDSLLDLATRFCLHHQHVFTHQLPSGALALQDQLHLPVELCEQLLRICHQEEVTISDAFAHIFKDLQNSRLRQLFLYDSPLTDRGLRSLLGHGLKTVVLFNCQNLTGDTLECINEWSDNLVTLSIVNTVELEQHQQVFPPFLDSDYPDDDEFTDDEREEEREENMYQKRRYILRAPRLRSLTVRDLCVVQGRDYFHLLCKALPNLSHLDLSGVVASQGGLHGLRFLLNCPHLVSLVLHNVKEVKEALPSLTQLSHLEHLDISQLDELYGDFAHPSHYIEELVKHLPKLRSLDISGTNLASTFREEDGKGRSDGQPCDIPGLAKRIDTPLDFLGLFWTQDEACRREHIPAIRVAGNHNQEQLLLAGTRYLDRPMVMEHVIDNLVQHVRMDPDFDQKSALSLAVNVLARYPRERKLLRHASALIYYLLESSKLGSNKGFTGVIRQRLLSTLLGVMRQYQEDGVLMRNGCMVLWRFDTFESGRHEELLAQYPQVVDILLFVVEHFRSTIYIITYCFYTIKCCQLLFYISAPGGLDQEWKKRWQDLRIGSSTPIKPLPLPLSFSKLFSAAAVKVKATSKRLQSTFSMP